LALQNKLTTLLTLQLLSHLSTSTKPHSISQAAQLAFLAHDPRVPASLIYSYLAQDLWLFGVAYGQVLDQYASSDGGRIRQWTRIDPTWVSVRTNPLGTEVIGYTVNGQNVPMVGVGSIIAFYNLADAGILNRAGRFGF